MNGTLPACQILVSPVALGSSGIHSAGLESSCRVVEFVWSYLAVPIHVPVVDKTSSRL